jgi:hypothetical protein
MADERKPVLTQQRNNRSYFYEQNAASFWRGMEFELLSPFSSEYEKVGNSYEKNAARLTIETRMPLSSSFI